MNIILVSDNLAKTRTFMLSRYQLLGLAALLVVTIFVAAISFNYLMFRYAVKIKSPYLQAVLLSSQQQEMQKNQVYLQENLNALAIKLGEMQSQLLRLDGLGEKLAKFAGLKPQELHFDQPPGRGGAISSIPQRNLSIDEFTGQMQALSAHVEDQSDQLTVLETLLLQDSVKKKFLPSNPPVTTGMYSSNFGWRIDPFSGQSAFHEGVDFVAPVGTPVVAAAGGVVQYSDYHSQYGNMVEIDHGNGLVSRYAHASKRLVKAGDVVLRGQKIAEVGSTGRSTGSHLHFEVRLKGTPQNPARFLQTAG